MFTALADRIRGLASLFWREVAKFGAVGGVAFVIDNG
ncbi:MAG: GtrA family protein, partial [Actinomycetes bacterium]